MPNPYKYQFELTSNTYNFITKNSVEYRIAFVIDQTLSAIAGIEINNIYQIIIEKVTDDAEKFDSLVSLTIKDILREFFQNSENSMIYICDDSDKKATTRFSTFERWYRSSKMTQYIEKVDNIIKFNSENQDFILYTSLLFHKNNTNKETILEIYNAIEEVLNNDK